MNPLNNPIAIANHEIGTKPRFAKRVHTER